MVFHPNRNHKFVAKFLLHSTNVPPGFEQAADIKRIIELARTTPMELPSQKFTQNVMQHLSENDISPRRTSYIFSLNSRSRRSLKRLIMPASVLELASCFFLAGFFYLVMGLSLYLGVYSLGLGSSTINWLKYQPIIAFFIAFSFITVGFILLKKTRLAFRIANLSIFCYILLAIINSVQAHAGLGNHMSYTAVHSVSAGSIIMGIFLAMTLNNFQRLSSLPPKDQLDAEGSCTGN